MSFVSNYLLNMGALAFRREPVRPLMFSYYITHQCNLNCRYCSDGDGKRFKEDPVPELETKDVKQLLGILRTAGDTLDITGGEPLIRSDLEEILADAVSKGFRTVLNTKGIGLEGRPDILKYSSVLVLSIDSLEADGLTRLIGRSHEDAERILKSLDYLLKNARPTGTKCVLSAVATPDNMADVRRVMDFAVQNSLGFQLSPEIVGTSVNPLLRDNEEYRRLLDQVIALKKQSRGILGVTEYLNGIRDFGKFCCHPLLMPVIRPDGRMYYPCLEWKKADIQLLEMRSYREALKAARKRFGELPRCSDCCHIFCHMALSLLQTHPISALCELKHWRSKRKGTDYESPQGTSLPIS
jgi:MoaA/NifB/PqqE/SkfB family radical SAM enzyme